MSESQRRRGWSAWIGMGSIAMAVLAAIALGVTVFVAQRALFAASDVVIRGEADSLVTSVASDLTQEGGAPTAESLQRALASHEAKGLRYLAVVERGGVRIAEAGTAELEGTKLHPGQSIVLGRRVRVAGMLGGPRGPRAPGMFFPPAPPALLVIELEPPVIAKLRADLTRISVVAAAAAAVLVAFAVAWARNAARLAAVERRAEREQRLVALGSMSSVMAHELRNPLASLKGHAQLLAEDLDDDKQRKKAERVVADAERLEDLTTSLLDFVRDGPIERTDTTPAELVERALADLPRERVDVSLERAPSSMSIDGARLARAVHNLVDNALKAAEEKRVRLTIERAGSDVSIVVRDEGPGLPHGEPIFEPFITTRVRGTGLGLPVARRIAEQHGGTLTAENDPSGGAAFTLRFPHRAPR